MVGSGLIKPRSPKADFERNSALEDAREIAKAREAKAHSEARVLDVITKTLSQTWYNTDYTWPFLRMNGRQLSVSTFYPSIKVAIDKFYEREDIDPKEILFKKEILSQNGIKYAAATPDKSMVMIVKELGL